MVDKEKTFLSGWKLLEDWKVMYYECVEAKRSMAEQKGHLSFSKLSRKHG